MRLLMVSVVAIALRGGWAYAANDSTTPATTEAASQPATEVFSTEKERISYTVGYHVATGIKQIGSEIDLDIFVQAIKDSLAGGPMKMNTTQIQETTRTLQEKQRARMQQDQARMMAERKELGEKNKAAGEKFLAENKTKEGVKVLDSGLQYKVLKSGDASSPRPTDSDRVKVNYRGTLIDGTEFDVSPPGEPRSFGVRAVVKGWTEALKLMHKGDKWQIYIPSELAYGENGRGNKIGPNSVLIFDMELVDIEAGAAPAVSRVVGTQPAGRPRIPTRPAPESKDQ